MSRMLPFATLVSANVDFLFQTHVCTADAGQ